MDKPVTPTGAPPLLTVRATPLAPGLDPRSSAVLREIVEQYVETGEPVGSRTLSRRLPLNVSPATIRNVMADLTDAGLLYAPHTSAGRLPTERGLRLFVVAAAPGSTKTWWIKSDAWYPRYTSAIQENRSRARCGG
jgi:hypothetical protein